MKYVATSGCYCCVLSCSSEDIGNQWEERGVKGSKRKMALRNVVPLPMEVKSEE